MTGFTLNCTAGRVNLQTHAQCFHLCTGIAGVFQPQGFVEIIIEPLLLIGSQGISGCSSHGRFLRTTSCEKQNSGKYEEKVLFYHSKKSAGKVFYYSFNFCRYVQIHLFPDRFHSAERLHPIQPVHVGQLSSDKSVPRH